MVKQLISFWWVPLIRGIIAILIGIMAVINPLVALVTFLMFVGAYWVVDGVFTLFLGRATVGSKKWWINMVLGVVSIAAGVFTFMSPPTTAFALAIFAGWWAIIVGVMQIVSAFQMRKVVENEWWLVIGGLLSVGFGVLLLLKPGLSLLTLVTVAGIWAIAFGVIMVGFSFRLKRAHDRLSAAHPTTHSASS